MADIATRRTPPEGKAQRPVELILARGLIQHLTAAAMLVDVGSTAVYFNDAAGELLGVRFEESGPISMQSRCERFRPVYDDGRPVPPREYPIEIALNEERPCFGCFRIRTPAGVERRLHVSAFPIAGNNGVQGAMAVFWAEDDDAR